jgi:hypothetical protein
MQFLEPRKQSIIVYTGTGSSNSWIWLADFLEREGFLDTDFISDPRMIPDTGADVIMIPGGDAFGIAEAFGEDGLRRISGVIEKGSGYVGICAGAYLPLRSSIAPLSKFNLIESKIANISSSPPDHIVDQEKYSVRYGCSYIFHPARGPMMLTGDAEILAPLYGGPSLIPSANERALLSFKGLTDETEVLVDRDICLRTMIGRAACIEGMHGKGRVVCVSTHLEHPDYPEANAYFSRLLGSFPSARKGRIARDHGSTNMDDARRTIADLRVLANALDSHSWKIGIKYWESEKLLFYIDAVKKRMGMRGESIAGIPPASMHHFERAKSDLRALRDDYDERILESAIKNLSLGASLFLTGHFSQLNEKLSQDGADDQRK